MKNEINIPEPVIPYDWKQLEEVHYIKAITTSLDLHIRDYETSEMFDEPQRSQVRRQITQNLETLAAQLLPVVQQLPYATQKPQQSEQPSS